MSEQSTTIISKVWGMCNPLRDDGVSYGDYLEPVSYTHLPHQTNIIRTQSSLLEMSSDYLFISKNLKILTSKMA